MGAVISEQEQAEIDHDDRERAYLLHVGLCPLTYGDAFVCPATHHVSRYDYERNLYYCTECVGG